ncbi:Putative ubiquitin carboxyl-terminal hydrolase 11 [Seminavis robusta]|uniref:ubiquitinyl hydrolase 1 n=1 Tax=Seminavis robusta TaxID=568900 RepID=A0A9N8H388_9STRA|nr:Putative ubiquitin carboxyl-terminal hydrolase 11 [Seminavis robusta]|eukprot:Sro54_g031950.1 Putative ubiquitin carboxyl-terminal hydrolase 11 (1266) ;mRNA; f:85282-89079
MTGVPVTDDEGEGEEMVLQEEDLPSHQTLEEEEEANKEDDVVSATTLEGSIAIASEKKEEGNAHFANQRFLQAKESYQQGVAALTAVGIIHSDDMNDTTTVEQLDKNNMTKALCVSLQSNLAQVCLKLQHYKQAEQHCSAVIEDWDESVAKVWYRRALAREKLGNLDAAVDDLTKSIRLLQAQKQDEQMKKTALQAFERVRKQMSTISSQKNKDNTSNDNDTPTSSPLLNGLVNGHHHHEPPPPQETTATAPAVAIVPPEPFTIRPSPEEQKQAVTKLLKSRTVALQQNLQVGEALFLIDWDWWSQWCRHVDLFSSSDSNTNFETTSKRMLALLPAGAILPVTNNETKAKKDTTKQQEKASDDDDDDDDTSMESSDSEEDGDQDGPPDPIDNSRLLMPTLRKQPSNSTTTIKFYQQWYRHFQPPPALEDDLGGDTPPQTALRPNLVRGYHYEILPREVYCALKSWYRELTPPICRRTTKKKSQSILTIDLYPTPATTTITASKHKCAACRARTATKRCTRCLMVWYCDRSCQEAHWIFHKVLCSKIAKNNNNNGTNINNHIPPTAEGRVGLNNMGNTCFMNSALQSLSHATPLTRHFLSNQFQKDLNPQNPLGTGGKLANAYGTVVKELWWASASTGGGVATSPTALKRAIALFAPRFAGCLQHDSQEFLAYLLDGLHEDLNRIRKAPYVEMPDFDNIRNNAHTRVAASQAWECHQRRNDSLVMDTFYGQFKSTCVCPSCNRVSVSFDAFNHVSLEIPTPLNQSTTWLSLWVFPDRGSSNNKNNSNNNVSPKGAAAVRYAFAFRRNNLVADLRQALSEVTGIPPTHLVICEVSDHTIVEILHDNKSLGTIRQDEIVTAYQVDPYTSTSIHIIVSHSLVEAATDQDGSPTSIPLRDNFGFPFLTSCSALMTCRQLWEHTWLRVRHMVMPLTEEGDEEDLDMELEDAYRQLLKIRVTDADGNLDPIFPLNAPDRDAKSDDDEEEEARTAYMPQDLDEKISSFLGEDCTSRFLFLSLEWTETMDTPPECLKQAGSAQGGNTNNKKKKKSKKNNKPKAVPKTISVNEKRFVTYTDHPCYAECVKKKREMDGIRGVSLDQCFETFTKPERLDENNMWYCSNCKEHVRALKTMELWRLPNVLVVHLKRFEFRHGFRRDKLATFVDFPLEGLDMSKHCAQWKTDGDPPGQLYVNDHIPAVYDLFAVVNHFGRMGFGHYTAYARKWDEEELSMDWALFDDSSVRPIGDGQGGGVEQVVSPAAYVLFYRRRNFN